MGCCTRKSVFSFTFNLSEATLVVDLLFLRDAPNVKVHLSTN